MKLYHSPSSPFVRKVRATAVELGLADRIELQPMDVAPATSDEAYQRSTNPLRKIPALVTDEGEVIVDSTVICDYLDQLAGGGRLMPEPGPERWMVATGHAIAHGMCDAAVLIRYETWARPESLRWPEWTASQWSKIDAGLSWFESRPESLSRPFDLAQLTLGCLVGYLDFRFEEREWRKDNPAVTAWASKALARPCFTQTAPG